MPLDTVRDIMLSLDEYVVVVQNRLTKGWQAFVMNVGKEPPHLIRGLSFSPARPPSDLPEAGKLDDGGLAAELGAFVSRSIRSMGGMTSSQFS